MMDQVVKLSTDRILFALEPGEPKEGCIAQRGDAIAVCGVESFISRIQQQLEIRATFLCLLDEQAIISPVAYDL